MGLQTDRGIFGSGKSNMLEHAKKLLATRDLLVAWTGRNIQARYQQSMLGWLWAIVQPIAQVLMFTLIFTRFVPVDTGGTPYVVFSYAALVPWTLLNASLTDMSNSLVNNIALITKIYFPREVLPIAAMLARVMDFGIACVLLFGLLFYFQMPILPLSLPYLLLIFVTQLILMLGLGLACAAANVFYRDIQSLLTLMIQLWFYASPIIYPASLVPENLRPFYFLNPMAGILEAYRAVLLNGEPPGAYLMPSIIISSLVFLLGFWFFKRVEFLFADLG